MSQIPIIIGIIIVVTFAIFYFVTKNSQAPAPTMSPQTPKVTPTSVMTQAPTTTPSVSPQTPTVTPTSVTPQAPTVAPTSSPTPSVTPQTPTNPPKPDATKAPTVASTSSPTPSSTPSPTSSPTIFFPTAPTKAPAVTVAPTMNCKNCKLKVRESHEKERQRLLLLLRQDPNNEKLRVDYEKSRFLDPPELSCSSCSCVPCVAGFDIGPVGLSAGGLLMNAPQTRYQGSRNICADDTAQAQKLCDAYKNVFPFTRIYEEGPEIQSSIAFGSYGPRRVAEPKIFDPSKTYGSSDERELVNKYNDYYLFK